MDPVATVDGSVYERGYIERRSLDGGCDGKSLLKMDDLGLPPKFGNLQMVILC